MIKFSFFFSLIVILTLGLHYTGFVNLFPEKKIKKTETSSSAWQASDVPSIEATNLQGESVSLDDFRGQIILLNFWASWCAPCLEEFPTLLKTVRWAGGKVTLLAISNDSSREDMLNFLDHQKHVKNKNIHVIWDPESEIARQFHSIKLPETFILNQQLQIVKKYTGIISFKDLKLFLEKNFED